MDALNELGALLGTPSEGTMLLGLMVAVGAAVGFLIYGVSIIVSGATDPVRRRLVAATAAGSAARPPQRLDLTRYIEPVAKYVLPK